MEKKPADTSDEYDVNHHCIGCTICAEIAPDNFRFDHERGCGYVCKQPDTDKEARLCAEAMDICPVDAIGVSGGT